MLESLVELLEDKRHNHTKGMGKMHKRRKSLLYLMLYFA